MKRFLSLLFFLLGSSLLFAQEARPKKDKLFGGINIGLSPGRNTVIGLIPQVGYRFNRFLSAGAGLNLQYATEKDRINGLDYSRTSQGVVGIHLFGRFHPVRPVFLQVQPEFDYTFGSIKFYRPPEQTTRLDAAIAPCVFVGGGFALPAGRGDLVATVLFELLQQPNSPYGKQVVIGLGYNFPF